MTALTAERLKRIKGKSYSDRHRDNWDRRVTKNDVEKLIAEIEALRKPFTVQVEIPPPDENGHCNYRCPFFCDGEPLVHCTQNWLDEELSANDKHWGTFHAHPGPSCPRYKE